MSDQSLLVLTGGIGGAKLCLGLQRTTPPNTLRIAVNTGDDFVHLGLHISPDIDTTVYTLAGLANTDLGWGRHSETWTFMEALASIGGETWFRLGDGDLALHIERTRRLRRGETLSEITQDVAMRLGINPQIYPASDDSVKTIVVTNQEELAFQDYFVRQRCAPVVQSLRFEGAESASVSPSVENALKDSSLTGIIIAPSNPYLSIDPILAIPRMRVMMRSAGVPIIAVTPIIGKQAVKGPTVKIMNELGVEPSSLAIFEHYGDLIDGFVLDEKDAYLSEKIKTTTQVCDTLMTTLEDRDRVARAAVELINKLRR